MIVMNRFRLIILVLLSVVLLSCSKDESEPSSDKLTFRGFESTEFICYVGGEPAEINLAQFNSMIGEKQQGWISYDRYRYHTYKFDDDTLEIFYTADNTLRNAYRFSNDSLFIYYKDPWVSFDYSWRFIAMGNESELRTKQGMYYIKTYRDGSVNSGNGFLPSQNLSIDDAIGLSDFQGIAAMEKNDTLILYNQTKLFK